MIKDSAEAATQPMRPRWMVVDDNEDVAEFLASLLESLGVSDVQRANSGPQAIAAFSAQPNHFQFVITDLDMPRMNGIELRSRLHEISPQVKIILVTATGGINEGDARQLGFCGLLTKPFLVPQVVRMIENAGFPANHPIAPNKT